jgi:hypothetical protein
MWAKVVVRLGPQLPPTATVHAKKEASMSPKQAVILMESTKGTARPHQPGQAVFRAILPEEIDWKPFPAFPPSVRLAVVVGEPLQDGPYTIRVNVPRDVKLMPHRHPEDRMVHAIPHGQESMMYPRRKR